MAGNCWFSIGFRDILDGLSNTAAFSERVKGIGSNNNQILDTTVPSSSCLTIASVGQPADASPQAAYAACKAAQVTPQTPNSSLDGEDSSGQRWHAGYASCTRYNHVITPNMSSCSINDNTGKESEYAASSRHSGGVNVLFCDGSVKFVKSTVNTGPWWALGSRSNNDIVSADQY